MNVCAKSDRRKKKLARKFPVDSYFTFEILGGKIVIDILHKILTCLNNDQVVQWKLDKSECSCRAKEKRSQ